MSSVRERLLGKGKTPQISDEDRQILLQAQLEYERDRLTESNIVLDSSSSTISHIFNANHDFRTRLLLASHALNLLKRRIHRDHRFVLFSFYFMLSIAIYVLSRRLGLLFILRSSTHLLFNLTSSFFPDL
jgi:hypothetical protein